MRSLRILGLSLGTMRLGIAVVERHSIFDCKMKSFIRGAWSEKKLHAILAAIEKHITSHNIKHIALKIPPPYTHTVGISQLIASITDLAKANRARLHVFTIQGLKQGWLKDKKGALNKKQLKKLILERYNMHHIYIKDKRTKTSHYEKIFEAVSAADIVLRKLHNK